MRIDVAGWRVALAGLAVVAVAAASPAAAQSALGEGESAWGLRVGASSDPDQAVGGVHFLETEIADDVYLVPFVEIGIGDDVLTIAGTAPVVYRFVVDAKVRPYVGGGLTIGWIDRDRPAQGQDDSDFEIAARAIGGILWRLDGGQEMFAELNLTTGEFAEAQAVVGWRF